MSGPLAAAPEQRPERGHLPACSPPSLAELHWHEAIWSKGNCSTVEQLTWRRENVRGMQDRNVAAASTGIQCAAHSGNLGICSQLFGQK